MKHFNRNLNILLAWSVHFLTCSGLIAGFFYATFILKPEKRKSMITSLSNTLTISKESTDAERLGRFSMPISRLLVIPNIK